MRCIFALILCISTAANAATIEGWISDSRCGATHAGTGMACAKKCISGGALPVFVDTEKRVWAIDNPFAIQEFYGSHVNVTATINVTNKSMHIDTIVEADPNEKSIKNPVR